jgi:hypothetical protein
MAEAAGGGTGTAGAQADKVKEKPNAILNNQTFFILLSILHLFRMGVAHEERAQPDDTLQCLCL